MKVNEGQSVTHSGAETVKDFSNRLRIASVKSKEWLHICNNLGGTAVFSSLTVLVGDFVL